MKKFKTGKIDFQAVLAASASGMAYTVITNAISNSGTLGAKWNAQKDVNYALGATALGAGLIYFLPKAKWSTPAGYGLLGAGGAVAAQVITSKIKPNTVNGFLSNAFKKAYSYTPVGAGTDVVKRLLNREHACQCATPKQLNGKRRYKLNGVVPENDSVNFDILGLN